MKRFSILLGLVLCAGLIVFLAAMPASAQGEKGSLTGIVTDPQGAAVPGAQVTLTDTATKTAQTTTTNDSGRYVFASINPGLYDIAISRTGFKVHKAAAQKVSLGTQLTLDVALEVGALTETVV